MTTLLCRLFLRGRDPSTPTGRRAYGTMAGAVGIALNLLLAAGKFIVGVLSGALSVQADAVNNLSDAGSQIISLVSFRIAARPADREHPFGHARIEYVASMIVSFAILLVGWELTYYIGEASFWYNAAFVALGELIALLLPGTVLFCAIRARKLDKTLFSL